MDVAFEQLFNLVGRHLNEHFGEGKDLSHSHTHELVARAILALTRFEIALKLFPLLIGVVHLQLFNELICTVMGRHIKALRCEGYYGVSQSAFSCQSLTMRHDS